LTGAQLGLEVPSPLQKKEEFLLTTDYGPAGASKGSSHGPPKLHVVHLFVRRCQKNGIRFLLYGKYNDSWCCSQHRAQHRLTTDNVPLQIAIFLRIACAVGRNEAEDNRRHTDPDWQQWNWFDDG